MYSRFAADAASPLEELIAFLHEKLQFLLVPVPMVFRTWIDPPIGFEIGGIDSAHPRYLVRIMSISKPGGASPLEVPFTEFVVQDPPQSAPAVWEFQMVGVTSGTSPTDPTTPT